MVEVVAMAVAVVVVVAAAAAAAAAMAAAAWRLDRAAPARRRCRAMRTAEEQQPAAVGWVARASRTNKEAPAGRQCSAWCALTRTASVRAGAVALPLDHPARRVAQQHYVPAALTSLARADIQRWTFAHLLRSTAVPVCA